MQSSTITLAVDKLNNNTPTDLVLTRFDDNGANRSTYISAAHTLVARDQMTLLRTFNKRTGVYYGSAKSAVKFTVDVTVDQADGTETKAPLIMEINFSIPVGTNAALVKELRQRGVAMLDRDDVMDNLNLKLDV